MDLDNEIQYLGRSPLQGISLEPMDAHYKKISFSFDGSTDSLVIPIGRLSSSTTAQINDSQALYRCAVVSRQHARLVLNRSTNKVTIQDLSSHHGTFVRSFLKYLATPCTVASITPTDVHDGDIVTLGKPVTDVHGGFVPPVSFKLKFLYHSSPNNEQGPCKFGLSCMSDSSSSTSDSEDEPEKEDRSSSMEISPHSSASSLALSIPLPLPEDASLEKIHIDNPELASGDRFTSPLEEDEGFLIDESEIPHNQLGLESDHQLPLNSSEYPSSSSLRLSPVSEQRSQSDSPQEQSQDQDNSSDISSPNLLSQDIFENHGASIYSMPFSVPPVDEVADGGDDDRMISSAPLDSLPVTPVQNVNRGREQSPIREDVQVDQVTLMPPPSITEPEPTTSKPTESDQSGIRAFFKAIGAVRSSFHGGNSSASTASSEADQTSPSSESLREEILKELRTSLHDYVQDEINKRGIQISDIETIVSKRIASSMESVNDLNKQSDAFRGDLDRLRTEKHGEYLSIQDTLKALDVRLDADFSTHEVAHSNLESRLDDVQHEMLGMHYGLLYHKIDVVEDDLSLAEQKASELSSRVNEFERRVEEVSTLDEDVKSLLGEMKTTMMAEFADREAKMMGEIEQSKMLVRQLMESRETDAMIVSEASKRPLEVQEPDQPETKRMRRQRRHSEALKSLANNVAKCTVLTMVGGIGAWVGLAYL